MQSESNEFLEYMKSLDDNKADERNNKYNVPQYDKQSEYISVKLLTGIRIYTKRGNVVGYCHCDTHRGTVTKALLKSHDCINKKCPFFKRDNPEYWRRIDAAVTAKQRRKQKIKAKKAKQTNNTENLTLTAQNMADELGYNIKITSVRKDREKNKYYIFYISEWEYNDFIRFLELKAAYAYWLCAKVDMKHLKGSDGKYITK